MRDRISVELVPRSREMFLEEVKTLSENFPSVDTVNIPDLAKYEISGLEAAKEARKTFAKCIPHIRASAVEKSEMISFSDSLSRCGIKEVLVIRGDQVEERSVKEPCSTLEIIKSLKERAPEIKAYAGLDQYRSDIEQELQYAEQKLETGAAGFFTQPFFDIASLRVYMDRLRNVEVFWGVSPVTTDRSQRYWQKMNNVVFPGDFRCDLDWNICFARDVLEEVRRRETNIYFMPIKTDIIEYLSRII